MCATSHVRTVVVSWLVQRWGKSLSFVCVHSWLIVFGTVASFDISRDAEGAHRNNDGPEGLETAVCTACDLCARLQVLATGSAEAF